MAIIEALVDSDAAVHQRVRLAALFHALADPTRLLILEHLSTGEHKVKELTEHLGLAQSTVSAHLACLRDNDLVAVRAQGRASIYSVNRTAHLTQLLALSQDLAAGTPAEHRWHEQHLPHPAGS